jgi:hypothetical protein
VVALDAPGVREIVWDGKNGRLLESSAGDDEFAAKLGTLKRSQKLRRRMSLAAGRTARQFSREISTRKTLELYRKVLKQTRRDRAVTARETLGPLQKRIEIEWSLLAQKAGAIVDSMAAGRSAGSA